MGEAGSDGLPFIGSLMVGTRRLVVFGRVPPLCKLPTYRKRRSQRPATAPAPALPACRAS